MTVSPLPVPAAGGAIRREGLTVFVRGLEIEAGIGVYDHEHGRLQKLVIDVTLSLEPHHVERLALTCLEDPQVLRCAVRIEKPGALKDAIAPGCEVVLAR